MKVHIEYCTSWGYGSKFYALKNALASKISGVVVEGNTKPPRKSSFEVTDEKGTILFSKFANGRFPNENDLNEIVKKLQA